jgi:hypothetical protein
MKTKEIDFDIIKMSKDLDIPVWEIKLQMGIPLEGTPDVSTFAEAFDAFEETGEDTEEEAAALMKCIELAINKEESRKVYEHTYSESFIEMLALRKELEFSTTWTEARDVYDRCLAGFVVENEALRKMVYLSSEVTEVKATIEEIDEYSWLLVLAMNKWAELSAEEKEKAQSFEENMAANQNAPFGSDVQNALELQSFAFAETHPQIVSMINSSLKGSYLHKAAIKKLSRMYVSE